MNHLAAKLDTMEIILVSRNYVNSSSWCWK